MKRIALVLSLAMALPATADVWDSPEPVCNRLWYMRNLVMDRAGYCFGSALGEALFDNSDCVGGDIRLSPNDSRQVAKMKALEDQEGCRVNTKARTLDLFGENPAVLRRLRDMPMPGWGSGGCTWAGAPIPLFDGYSSGSVQIGQIRAGDRLSFEYESEGKWSAVSTSGSKGEQDILGWFDHTKYNTERNCTDWAG